MVDTKITYLGLELKNPIIVSSSGLTKDLPRLQKCAEAGCGAAVMKSLFEAEVARNDPTPCYKITATGQQSFTAMNRPPPGALSVMPTN
jgi:dihydroorotate dehydrogenase